ncbi:hypothetical protein BEL01nite_74780 [Bradyrhizobium elkanii]|nr:hypothetical protein BEL01nite_74780 [Bradyrhizobium elkanii]
MQSAQPPSIFYEGVALMVLNTADRSQNEGPPPDTRALTELGGGDVSKAYVGDCKPEDDTH